MNRTKREQLTEVHEEKTAKTDVMTQVLTIDTVDLLEYILGRIALRRCGLLLRTE